MPNPVTHLYAKNAGFKALWANSSTSASRAHYLEASAPIADALIGARSADQSEILLKLIELQEWIIEDASQSAKALLASIIADVEALTDRPDPTEAAAAPMPPSPRPGPKPAGAAEATAKPAPVPEPTTADPRVGKATATPPKATPPDPNLRARLIWMEKTKAAAPKPTPAPAPAPAAAPPGLAAVRVAGIVATMKVDKRARPVIVDGVIYPSLIIAANSTGRTVSEIRKIMN